MQNYSKQTKHTAKSQKTLYTRMATIRSLRTVVWSSGGVACRVGVSQLTGQRAEGGRSFVLRSLLSVFRFPFFRSPFPFSTATWWSRAWAARPRPRIRPSSVMSSSFRIMRTSCLASLCCSSSGSWSRYCTIYLLTYAARILSLSCGFSAILFSRDVVICLACKHQHGLNLHNLNS